MLLIPKKYFYLLFFSIFYFEKI